ncbi:glycoside hydrolase family 27 protein [Sphingobacterium detergens]|uniref:Alpha-galactosidase n=1 Tax=Sphingobacterium detergens TaxID=1145106 RepID=A0A420ADQ0_SPHD1|nr:glycoside hydrolase family 27 protein [Sphingobacterium detergens]RKE42523.1 alpha galactosidase A [Sphingobacterium detergens]
MYLSNVRTLRLSCLLFLQLLVLTVVGQENKAPIMGWSSWNNFRIHINENLIKQQADALISTGLYQAGYRYINVDDGYFGGRDSHGKLYVDSTKFPNGMDAIAAYLHQKGLKAGLYSEGGRNTCGSIWDNDKKGIGVGMYGHEQQDAELFFKEWNFDFIKIDWCGGLEMKLNDQEQYSKIISAIRGVKPNARINICRWQFPGEWAIKLVDSWRISEDIRNNFGSVLAIIDLNKNLNQYSSPGHYNDMDMLQVGRGMTYEEDKTHFSMWCMLNSPLLAGNDLTKMSKETIAILTNRELIALNQDTAFKQAVFIGNDGTVDLWVKQLQGKNNTAIAMLNRSDKAVDYHLDSKKLQISPNTKVRDLWIKRDLGRLSNIKTLHIPPHGIVLLETK